MSSGHIAFPSPYPDPAPAAPAVIAQSFEIQSPYEFPLPTANQPSPPPPPPVVAPEPITVVEPVAPTVGSVSKSHLVGGKTPEQWTWDTLRDYVVEQIVQRHGDFPRNPLRESGIFKGFISRHGDRSGEIAIFAMEGCNGWWKNSPIGIERFCKGSDPWFAAEIITSIDSRQLAPTG